MVSAAVRGRKGGAARNAVAADRLPELTTSTSLEATAVADRVPLAFGTAAAVGTIAAKIQTLGALVVDVRTSARVEREDFAGRLRPVAVDALLAGAAFARTLPSDHPLTAESIRGRVDPERIGQLLRNLVGITIKDTPPRMPLALRAVRRGDRVRIEVAEAGPGIPPEDLARIFEKAGRGRDAIGCDVAHGAVEMD